MKAFCLRTLTIALCAFLLGGGIDRLSDLEIVLGLDTLFQIRGIRAAPSEVVVVAMDEGSENRLALGLDLTRWRGFHAKLIQQLQRQGVALIVFDLQFIASHADQDTVFAAAMSSAGNVLLTECVQKLRRGVEDFYGREECSEHNQQPFVQKQHGQDQSLAEQLVAMRKVAPTRILAEAALDHAPFYLSSDADNETIHEAWTFLDTLAESPALPVLAWFYYLQRSTGLPGISQADQPISAWLTERRRHCSSALDTTLKSSTITSILEQRIEALICQGDSVYLDFYGPPQTLRMVSYSDVYDGKALDLKNKVVFIGKANRKYSPGKTDFFPTPFTATRSGKMAGVEIMATQFANLLEDRFVTTPFSPGWVLAIFSLAISLLLTRFPGFSGLFASLTLGVVYTGVAVWLFDRSGLWLPIAVPLLAQLPLCWLIALVWSRRDLINERKRILAFARRVFPQWIPFVSASPGQWYPEQGSTQTTTEREVCGLCLATDIEGYTAIAAQHTSKQMWELLNAYYQVLGHPVSTHQGIIADVTGDAMMAVWIDLPLARQRSAACLAALDMQLALDRFNQASSLGNLSTRIGLHEGDMTLGRLDAGEGSHYRAIGDTVNAASRIQGVNKYLGTRVLASAAIVTGLNPVIYRSVGVFRLVGREEPLELVEVVGKETEVSAAKLAMFKEFSAGLNAFQHGQWQAARACFKGLLNKYGHDGPTQFYLDLALAYQDNPPQDWHGVVTREGK